RRPIRRLFSSPRSYWLHPVIERLAWATIGRHSMSCPRYSVLNFRSLRLTSISVAANAISLIMIVPARSRARRLRNSLKRRESFAGLFSPGSEDITQSSLRAESETAMRGKELRSARDRGVGAQDLHRPERAKAETSRRRVTES